MKNSKRNNRRQFAIQNNLLILVNKTFTEKETINIFNGLGIEIFMCIDSEDKDKFFELSGLMVSGNHNQDLNQMEFTITEI